MAELLAAFPKSDRTGPAGPISDAVRLVEEIGLGTGPHTESASGATVVVTSSPAHTPTLYNAPGGGGWIAVKGIMFDTRSEEPRVDLEALWHDFASDEGVDWNRYEGTFALAAWDTRRRLGVAVNDQTSQLNFYYGEDAAFVYATTTALPLARALGRGLDPQKRRPR